MNIEEKKEKRRELARKYRKRNRQLLNEKQKIYQQNNKEKKNKYLRERYKNSIEVRVKIKAFNERWIDNNKERYEKYKKEYRKSEHYRKLCLKHHRKSLEDIENYKKYLIRQRDYRKFVKGEIVKSECEECSIKKNLEIHHIDYEEEGNIMILCRKCHRKLHKKLGTKGYF